MVNTALSTPKHDGFWMPAEFEPHSQCWMIWPERTDNWRQGAKPAQQVFAEVATVISQFEPVTMCVSSKQYANARSVLPENIRIVEMSTNDSWMRDCGPTFLRNRTGEIRGVDWEFNAWGGLEDGLYFPWDLDDMVAQKVLELERKPRYRADFVLEGGSIHADGEGTLIVTEECLLNENRNPKLSKSEIETKLMDYLNVEKIIWIPRGVYLDETDGHVDNICCFVGPAEVVLTWTEDKSDPQYSISNEAFEILKTESDARGRKLKIHKLHQPSPMYITQEESTQIDQIEGVQPRKAGDRLAASYVNFYIANKAIIMPVFDDPNDKSAKQLLSELFPGYSLMPIQSREILLGGGNIHCITQQQPLGN